MDAFVGKGVNKLKICDVVILLIAVNVVDKVANWHRPVMLAPDSPMCHDTVCSDVALWSDVTRAILTSLHNAPPIGTLYFTVHVLSSPSFLSLRELLAV